MSIYVKDLYCDTLNGAPVYEPQLGLPTNFANKVHAGNIAGGNDAENIFFELDLIKTEQATAYYRLIKGNVYYEDLKTPVIGLDVYEHVLSHIDPAKVIIVFTRDGVKLNGAQVNGIHGHIYANTTVFTAAPPVAGTTNTYLSVWLVATVNTITSSTPEEPQITLPTPSTNPDSDNDIAAFNLVVGAKNQSPFAAPFNAGNVTFGRENNAGGTNSILAGVTNSCFTVDSTVIGVRNTVLPLKGAGPTQVQFSPPYNVISGRNVTLKIYLNYTQHGDIIVFRPDFGYDGKDTIFTDKIVPEDIAEFYDPAPIAALQRLSAGEIMNLAQTMGKIYYTASVGEGDIVNGHVTANDDLTYNINEFTDGVPGQITKVALIFNYRDDIREGANAVIGTDNNVSATESVVIGYNNSLKETSNSSIIGGASNKITGSSGNNVIGCNNLQLSTINNSITNSTFIGASSTIIATEDNISNLIVLGTPHSGDKDRFESNTAFISPALKTTAVYRKITGVPDPGPETPPATAVQEFDHIIVINRPDTTVTFQNSQVGRELVFVFTYETEGPYSLTPVMPENNIILGGTSTTKRVMTILKVSPTTWVSY